MAARHNWRRLGHIYCAAGESDEFVTHAAYPTPLVLDDGRVRVFFSPRDRENRSGVAALDLELRDERFAVLGPPSDLLLAAGPRGGFDDSGVSVSCVLPAPGGGLHLYYLGWNLGVTVPFRNAIGLALADPGEAKFRRASPAPLLDRAEEDPFTLGYPWVMRGPDGWRMWYGTHLEWGARGLEMRHAIRHAASADGRSWLRDARPTLMPEGGAEFALSRPCVVRDADAWRMWYSRRLEDYRLGYAESADGTNWVRDDAATALTGPAGEWEGESCAYPAVFDHGGRRYLLYNGRGYGRTGFGLAVLE